jgi:hypothetical protein
MAFGLRIRVNETAAVLASLKEDERLRDIQ